MNLKVGDSFKCLTNEYKYYTFGKIYKIVKIDKDCYYLEDDTNDCLAIGIINDKYNFLYKHFEKAFTLKDKIDYLKQLIK